MPTFKSFGDFGAELNKMAATMEKEARQRITRPMGEKAQKIAEAAASADLGGDPKFSGWKPRLDTQLKDGQNGSTILMPTKSGAGPWTVAQVGRNQGSAGGFSGPGIGKSGLTAKTKAGGLKKVKSFKSKRWNGTTKGKNTADKALARMETELPKIAEDGVRAILQKHFDVT